MREVRLNMREMGLYIREVANGFPKEDASEVSKDEPRQLLGLLVPQSRALNV